jgi:hypothetical protein
LLHDFAERFFGILDAGADAVVTFAEGFEEVGESTERAGDTAAGGEAKAEPKEDEEGINGDLEAKGLVIEVKENGGGSNGG